MKRLLLASVMAASLVGGAAASAQTVSVPGTANPFLAGHPAGTLCCGGDNAPAHSPVLALTGLSGGETFTITTDGGANFAPGVPFPTADGGNVFNMTADYGTGISAPLGVNASGLVGVFLTASQPAGAAPAQRNDGISFLALTPDLGQIFWMGDGLTGTGSGTLQQFTAPTGADRLFLGTADGFGWFNNIGTIRVTFNGLNGAIPEPGTWAMMLTGLLFAGGALRLTRRGKLAST